MAERIQMAILIYVLMPFAVFLNPRPVEAMAFPIGSPYRCQRSSPRLNECVKEGLTKVIKHFKSGDTMLGVPSLDPMDVPYLQVRHDDGNLTLDLTMKNVQIKGFTDINLVKVTTMLDDVNKLEVTGKTPNLQISGEYVSEGLIINFPLHSSGPFTINMTEVTSSWIIYLRERTSGQTKYLEIDGFHIEMMPITISFRPAEQFDGDNNLGEAVNVILNENSSEIYSLVKEKLWAVFSGILTELANNVLSQVPEVVYLE